MLIATAGHVDHGKTTLVNALTGVDTDRLPEEKARGLTIDLGFAYDERESGRVLGFIDVPGHEKFVRNMAAGVGAIDVALLVVAADDGPMPQTREHLAILELFGISRGLVAVTRTDLVDDDRLAGAHVEIRDMLAGTRLENAELIDVSAPTGVGIDELKQRLDAMALDIERSANGLFRLAIDRSFSVHGAGTIVTGAVFSGAVQEGESVSLMPGGTTARVRSIHADNQPATEARAGQRAALNLVGIQPSDAARGQWLCDPVLDVVTQCADVRLRVLGSEAKALRHWTPVHISSGAGATTGRLSLYDVRAVAPGEEGYGQIVLDDPTHFVFGDHFILRDQSASRTIGGGVIVDPFSHRHRRFRRTRVPVLEALDNPDHSIALANAVEAAVDGIDFQAFALGRSIPSEQLESLRNSVMARQSTSSDGVEVLVSAARFDAVTNGIKDALAVFHDAEPSATGCEPELVARSISASASLFYSAIDALIRDGELARQGVRIRLAGHTPRLDEEQQALLDQLLALLEPDMTKPPPLSELAERCAMERSALSAAVEPLARAGHLVRVAENRVFHPAAIDELAGVAEKLASEHMPRGFDAREFRDASGIGRNVTIDVLEYFDSVGLTRRLADRRTFRRPIA